MQSRDIRDILQLICIKLDKEKDYTNFCLTCKLWNEIGQLTKNIMADKFKMYCYKQTIEHIQGKQYIKLTECYHLRNDSLHGPWKLTLTCGDFKVELIRYVYSFGKLVKMASQEEIDKIYSKLELKLKWL